MGIPADITDRSLTEGWVDNSVMYEAEKARSRLRTLLYAIPAIMLGFFAIKAIKQKNERLFYWTFLAGLTLFQVIPVTGLLSAKGQDHPLLIRPLLWTFFLAFLAGQVYSVYRIITTNKAGN